MSVPNKKLSDNFMLYEFLRSETAERDSQLRAEQYEPPEEVVNNLQYMVNVALQPLRQSFRHPLRINSGYRSHLVNRLVGGSEKSQHRLGQAADCELSPEFLSDVGAAAVREEVDREIGRLTSRVPGPDVNENFYLFAYICLHLDELDIDQVIHEYGDRPGRPAWVHISASEDKNRRQILLCGSYTNGRYVKATVDNVFERCCVRG